MSFQINKRKCFQGGWARQNIFQNEYSFIYVLYLYTSVVLYISHLCVCIPNIPHMQSSDEPLRCYFTKNFAIQIIQIKFLLREISTILRTDIFTFKQMLYKSSQLNLFFILHRYSINICLNGVLEILMFTSGRILLHSLCVRYAYVLFYVLPYYSSCLGDPFWRHFL